MSYVGTKDFFLEVSRGKVAGASAINKVCHSGDVGTTIKTVGQYGSGQQYVYPTSATIDYLSSNNAADTHTITIVGLDASYAVVTQTKTLTGTTPVAIDTPLLRVNYLYNDTSTSTTGTIFLWDSPSGNGTEHTAGVPTTASTVKAFIGASTSNGSDEIALGSVFTIPAGYTGYMIYGDTTVSDQKAMELSFWIQEYGKVPKIAHHIDIHDNIYGYPFKISTAVPEKSDVEIKADVDTGTAHVAAHYELILFAN